MIKQVRYSVIEDGFKIQNIDCESKLDLCGSRCCKLDVILTIEEAQSGLFDYDPERPYYLKKDKGGYCVYLEHGRCSIWENRPKHCAGFVCSLFDKTKENIFDKI